MQKKGVRVRFGWGGCEPSIELIVKMKKVGRGRERRSGGGGGVRVVAYQELKLL